MVVPVLQVSSLKQMSDQTQEAVIMELLPQDGEEDSMINSVSKVD